MVEAVEVSISWREGLEYSIAACDTMSSRLLNGGGMCLDAWT